MFNLLVMHNERFNNDMRIYVAYLYNNIIKQKQNKENIFKSGQSYASLKNRNQNLIK